MGGFMKKNSIYVRRFGILSKGKAKHLVKTVLVIAFLLVGICLATIKVQNVIQDSVGKLAVANDLNAAWIGSVASYWGGIIGGLISGILTVIGVALTIKYYKDSDASKSRIEHMPFLMAEVKDYTDKKIDNIITGGVEILKINSISISNRTNDNLKNRIFCYRVKLRNIGQGFANTLVIYTGETVGGNAYNKVIEIKDSTEFCFEVYSSKDVINDEIKFGVCYIDCMTNEYNQFYSIKWESKNPGNAKLENGYPCFAGQAHDIGNI